MKNPTSIKKVKTFRISETTEYMLRRISEYQGISEGKTLEKLIQKEYECLFPRYDEKNHGKITIQDYDKTENEIREFYAKLHEKEQSENVSDK